VTAEQAPSGDIGRLTNYDIAEEMFFDGDPDQLIEALVGAGLLDRDDHHRLLIHDWARHTDFNTKRKLARHGQPIFTKGGEERPVANPDASKLVNDRAKRATPLLPEPEPEPEPKTPRAAFAAVPEKTPHGEFTEAWNRLCGGLPKVTKLTPKRRRHLAARIRDGLSLADFEQTVRICSQTPFLRGESERGWKADFDWLIENDTNAVKVREGKYGVSASASGQQAIQTRYVDDPANWHDRPEYQPARASRGAA
jgi:hypothetical protein